ncbi:hypothetical protein C0991_005934 [Blastosporella zonata]|nr:hypothetical protein C0991_005934 [Blastosporella zonata]
MIHVEDKSLALPDGRILAYADNGNTSSSTLVLFLHGAFSVGDASHLPRVLIHRNVHYVAPSLPGWGRSSPAPSHVTYATTIAADITALITHLHPTDHPQLRLYLAGHAFGSAAVQMLYGLPHPTFPLVSQLKALVLLAPCSPPHCHQDYARSMSWLTYLFAGPLARYVPCYSLLTTQLARLALRPHFTSDNTAEAFLCRYLQILPPTDTSDDDLMQERWRDEQEEEVEVVEEDEDEEQDEEQDLLRSSLRFNKSLGRNAHRSVASTWHGFTSMPAVYHSTWGHFTPCAIETTCPVLVVSSQNDTITPKAMAHWLATSYTHARLKNIPGGHVSAFFHLDEIWNEVFEMSESPPSGCH